MAPKKLYAFVLMPFDSDFDDIYKIGIKETADECGVNAERLDEQLFGEGMMDRIYRQIELADIIIADLSSRNSNVFYELGYAHAKDKICILLTKEANDIPFDLKHRRHVVYGDSITYLREELKKNIEWAKSEIASKRSSQLRIDFKTPTGDLTTTKQTAECAITFTFDIFNDSNSLSPGITAVYLYAGNEWEIIQDGKECAHTKSDTIPFNYRYFLTTPSSRIAQKGWFQIKCKAKRILAYAWKGDEIKYEYTVGGRGLLRVVTEAGNYDHDFDFNLKVEEFPF